MVPKSWRPASGQREALGTVRNAGTLLVTSGTALLQNIKEVVHRVLVGGRVEANLAEVGLHVQGRAVVDDAAIFEEHQGVKESEDAPRRLVDNGYDGAAFLVRELLEDLHNRPVPPPASSLALDTAGACGGPENTKFQRTPTSPFWSRGLK